MQCNAFYEKQPNRVRMLILSVVRLLLVGALRLIWRHKMDLSLA